MKSPATRIFFLVTLCLLTFSSTLSWALVSSEVSLSSGYYRDYQSTDQFPVFFSWNLTHSAPNGIQTVFDVGANNNIIQNQWGFYIYEGYVTVPLGAGFEGAPYRKSRIQVGRQFLTEGFEMALLDGLQIPLYWSEKGGVKLIGGATTTLQEKQLDLSAQLYGGSLQQKFLGATWKAGAFHKRRTSQDNALSGSDTITKNVAFGGTTWSFEKAPFKPTLFAKGQWDLATQANEQAQGELALYPSDILAVGVNYSKRVPSLMDPNDVNFIYKLFSVSPQITQGGYITLLPSDFLHIQLSGRRALYDSAAGPETGNELEATISWYHKTMTWIPSITRIDSWGGTILEPSLTIRKDLARNLALRAQGAAAKIDKINGISAWAYQTRTGIDYNPIDRLRTLALLEFGRNHIFEYDVRGVVYLSYFLF